MTDKNKTPYTAEEMLAVDTLTARYMGGYNNGLGDIKELAAEHERVKKERDDLAEGILNIVYHNQGNLRAGAVGINAIEMAMRHIKKVNENGNA